MTTVLDANVHNIALRGTFDDCQDIVKGMFTNRRFRDEVKLSGVNSINWGRIVAQIVYYFTAAVCARRAASRGDLRRPDRQFRRHLRRLLRQAHGPADRTLAIATNANDILARTIETGRYEVTGVQPTISPSMDIQVSSNFERLLFECVGRDGRGRGVDDVEPQPVGRLLHPDDGLAAIREPVRRRAHRRGRDQLHHLRPCTRPRATCSIRIRRSASTSPARCTGGTAPVVTLATAHPAKFPAAVHGRVGH